VNPILASGNPAARANGLADMVARGAQWREQLIAIGLTLVLALVATAVIGFAIKATFGLRPATEVERQGLDVTEHGEEGYVL
jgi:Amt family ammonium transporter